MKGLGCRGLETEEENMRNITRIELQYRTGSDLIDLLNRVLLALSYVKEGSPEWHNLMRSLDIIRQEQAARTGAPRPCGGPRF